jgi:predicted ester cyclase
MSHSYRTQRTVLMLILGLVLVGCVFATPHGHAGQTPEVMTQQRTEEVMGAYMKALVNNEPVGGFFADDIVVTMVDVGQEIVGRDAAEAAIVDFHQVAFASELELRSLIIGPGIAYAEVVFGGTHTGDFVGIPATGREVSVPYAVVSELSNDQITAIRLYGPAAGLIQQITGEGTPATSTPAS